MLVLKCRRRGGDLLAFGPDSRMLACRSERGLQLWRDIHSGAKPVVFRELHSIASLQFTPCGEWLVFDGRGGGTIHLPTLGIRHFPEPEGYRYSSMSPDGRHLLSVSLPADRGKNHIVCQPLQTAFAPRGKHLWKVRLKRSFGGRPIPLADGRFLVAEEEGPRVATRKFLYVLRSGDHGSILSQSEPLDWFSERESASSDGHWLVGQHTNQLRIWDLNRLAEPPRERNSGSKKIFTDVAFHPSSRWLAATSTDETVRFYETETWSVCRTFSWNLGKMVGIAFSPDGALAAAGSDTGRIVIWDVEA
ncbi:MAG: WD40 repeat domain-containing protein [Gemmataceae bacterium]